MRGAGWVLKHPVRILNTNRESSLMVLAKIAKFVSLAALATTIGGCASAKKMWATMTGDALNGAIEEQGTYVDRGEREAREAGWKDYWRSNPDANPRMAEAFKE